MESIEQAWIYLIDLTAGMAVVWLLRWYWWRVNAWAEIAAMAGSVLLANGMVWAGLGARAGILTSDTVAVLAVFYRSEYDFLRALAILVVCSLLWVGVAFLTPADDDEHLERFYRKVRPGGWWGPIASRCGDVEPDVMPGWRRWLGWGTGMTFLYGCHDKAVVHWLTAINISQNHDLVFAELVAPFGYGRVNLRFLHVKNPD